MSRFKKKTKIRKTRKNMQKGGNEAYARALEKYKRVIGKLPPFIYLSNIIPQVDRATFDELIENLTNKASNYPSTITNNEQIEKILRPVIEKLLNDLIAKGGTIGFLLKRVNINMVFSQKRQTALIDESNPNDLIPALIEDLEVFKRGKESNAELPPRFKFKAPLLNNNNNGTSDNNNEISDNNNRTSDNNNGTSDNNNGTSKIPNTYVLEPPDATFPAEAGSKKRRTLKRRNKRHMQNNKKIYTKKTN